MRFLLLLVFLSFPARAGGSLIVQQWFVNQRIHASVKETPPLDLTARASTPAEASPVPTSAPLISDQVAVLLGLAAGGAIASAAASAWNTYLRALKKKGQRAGPLQLAFGAFLNGVAFNFDQAARQASAARGLKQ